MGTETKLWALLPAPTPSPFFPSDTWREGVSLSRGWKKALELVVVGPCGRESVLEHSLLTDLLCARAGEGRKLPSASEYCQGHLPWQLPAVSLPRHCGSGQA